MKNTTDRVKRSFHFKQLREDIDRRVDEDRWCTPCTFKSINEGQASLINLGKYVININ